ncbi:MAG TPA: FKBP-type peptidyl-prolyl cis-trans isomerase [Thermoanaerobaculia bacterium]|nr:FKBP-type peptidyl-prolyl cis-trans isomerase [Thermoanaerobaculia bacterium]
MRKLLPLLSLLALPLFAAEKPAPPADLTAPPSDAERLESGLVTKKLADGTSSEKLAGEQIPRVRFTVWKSDGTLVQHVPGPSSLMIATSKMLPGWAETVRMMTVGEKRRAWVPASLSGGRLKEGESFVFDTELVGVVDPPVTPPDVSAPPPAATMTDSGLAYLVLRPGTGTVHPKRSNTVVVHYSGWTTDGKMFDSSVARGESAVFPLTGVIKGWIEGLQLMVEGEKTRFWIPSRLAYGKEKGKPQGMLVFDIELMEIKK